MMAQDKILNIGSVFVILVSIFINFNNFLMGNFSSWLNILTSILYIIFWYLFILIFRNNKKSLIYSILWSSLTFVSAIPILVANLKPMMTLDWAIPMAIIFITPFYGIEAIVPQSKFIFASILILMISFTWIIISLFFIKKIK